MSKQPSGGQRPQHFLTKEEREWIKERLAEKGMSRAALARAVGLTRQFMYQLLSGEARHTSDWAAIVSALGGTPPSGQPPIVDERLRTIVRRWHDLSPADQTYVNDLVIRLHRPKS